MHEIRLLKPEDAAIYVALRREMLTESPGSFGSSPETDRGVQVDLMREYIEKPEQAIVAAIEDGRAVASAAVKRDESYKRRHLALLWGVYVTPKARRNAVGRTVVTKAIDVVRQWPGVEVLSLTVSESAPNAQRLYESLGFVTWGIEPDVLRVNGRSLSEAHMRLKLRPWGEHPVQ